MRRFYVALLVCGIAACSNGNNNPDGGGGTSGGTCAADPDYNLATAIALTSGKAVTGQICPKGDLDFYTITVPAGSNLITVSAGYGVNATNVQLLVQLLNADGMTRVDNESLIADSMPDDLKSQLDTTFKVPQPGTYVIMLRDYNNAQVDLKHTYSLTATVATDPDTHEPDDTMGAAKAGTGVGWFAYQNDVDYYDVTTTAAQPLVQFNLNVPMSSTLAAIYQLVDSSGNMLFEGTVPPGAPLTSLHYVGAPGTYYVILTPQPGKAPDYAAADGYTIQLNPLAESDPNEPPGRNDEGSTATCLQSGDTGACAGTVFNNAHKEWTVTGRVAESSDRDIYRFNFDPNATDTGVITITASMNATSPISLAADLLVPDESSPCAKDSDCVGLAACNTDSDCVDTSHICQNDLYDSCPTKGQPCNRCYGSHLCIPGATGAKVCGYIQYTLHNPANTAPPNQVITAQPLFKKGEPYYVVVHSYDVNAYDYNNDYTLKVDVDAEPDTATDGSFTASARDNFYDPYRLTKDDLSFDLSTSASQAKDVTAQIAAGTPITGHISYHYDEDWYVFNVPAACTPGMDCGLRWQYTQPGPSNMRVGFFIYRASDMRAGGAFGYRGTDAQAPPMLTMPVTQVYGWDGTAGDTDCSQCALSRHDDAMSGGPPARYYIQVMDLSDSGHWDTTNAYSFSLVLGSESLGCPATCRVYMGECGVDPSSACNPSLSFP
jgi:hypothetical protein